MGLQVNLTKMICAPETIFCPRCKTLIQTRFDDYDIECGDPNPTAGVWNLDAYCDHCEVEINVTMDVGSPAVTLRMNDS
jgi:hypothetical protein